MAWNVMPGRPLAASRAVSAASRTVGSVMNRGSSTSASSSIAMEVCVAAIRVATSTSVASGSTTRMS